MFGLYISVLHGFLPNLAIMNFSHFLMHFVIFIDHGLLLG